MKFNAFSLIISLIFSKQIDKAIEIEELKEQLNYQYTTMMIQTHLEYQKTLTPYINWEVQWFNEITPNGKCN